MEMPFVIGETLWTYESHPRKVAVKCPICAGSRRFLVTLGCGEVLSVECDGCGLGFDGPQGVIHEYAYDPRPEPFTIASVASFSAQSDWWLTSTQGGYASFASLCRTEAEALAAGQRHADESLERRMESYCRKRKDTQRAGWSVRYHREQIADMERRIAWHRSKIEAPVAAVRPQGDPNE